MSLFNYLSFFIWIFILIGFSFLIDRIYARIVAGRKYRVFVAPGVIVHELSHAIACLFTGARIYKISFFSPRGGYVKHAPPRLPVIGKLLISFAPLFGIIAALWGISKFLNWQINLPTLDLTADWFRDSQALFFSALSLIKAGFATWQFWLGVYLVISLTIAMAPSKQDFKNSIFAAIFLLFIGTLLLYFDPTRNFIVNLVSRYLFPVISLGIIFELLALIIGVPIYFVKRALRGV